MHPIIPSRRTRFGAEKFEEYLLITRLREPFIHDKYDIKKRRRKINIQDFPLSWRWIGPTHADFPVEIIKTFRPLSPDVAGRLARSSPEIFSHESLKVDAKDVLETQRWLKNLEVSDQEVSLVWSDVLAISLPWSIFCEYWDDFCYPSSDDIDIFLDSEKFVLRWHHYEIFEHDPFML